MNKTETKLQQTAIVLHGNHWKRLGITLGNYLRNKWQQQRTPWQGTGPDPEYVASFIASDPWD